MDGGAPRERRFLPNPIEEWDRDESFMIRLLVMILDKIGWMGDKDTWDIKAFQEIKESFYEEKSRGRQRQAFPKKYLVKWSNP